MSHCLCWDVLWSIRLDRSRITRNASVTRWLRISRLFFGVSFSRVSRFLAPGFHPVSYPVLTFCKKLARIQSARLSPSRKRIPACLTLHNHRHGIQRWRDLVRGWQSGFLFQFLQLNMHVAFFVQRFRAILICLYFEWIITEMNMPFCHSCVY